MAATRRPPSALVSSPAAPRAAKNRLDGVGRRERQPVVVPHPPGRLAEGGAAVGRLADLDHRQLHRRRPQRLEPFHEPRGLLPGPGHDDPTAEERPVLVPAQVQGGHRPHHQHGRRLDRLAGQTPEGRAAVCCSGRVPQVTAATGVSAGSPPAMSRRAISSRLATPMRTAIGPADPGDRLPVDRDARLPLLAGDDRERRGQPPLGHRERRRRRDGQGRGDPGDDLEGHAGGLQGGDLLAAPGEDERVAALEPDDHVLAPCPARRAGR